MKKTTTTVAAVTTVLLLATAGTPAWGHGDEAPSTGSGTSAHHESKPADPKKAKALPVQGVDFAFSGKFDKLKAGAYNITLQNLSSTEHHELVLVRINDDTTETLDQLLAMPEEEADKKVEFAGVIHAHPGEFAPMSLTGNLTAGRWAMICFESVGGAPDGEPHFAKGMKREIIIK